MFGKKPYVGEFVVAWAGINGYSPTRLKWSMFWYQFRMPVAALLFVSGLMALGSFLWGYLCDPAPQSQWIVFGAYAAALGVLCLFLGSFSFNFSRTARIFLTQYKNAHEILSISHVRGKMSLENFRNHADAVARYQARCFHLASLNGTRPKDGNTESHLDRLRGACGAAGMFCVNFKKEGEYRREASTALNA